MPSTNQTSHAASSTAYTALTSHLESKGRDATRTRALIDDFADEQFSTGVTAEYATRAVKHLFADVQWPQGEELRGRGYRVSQMIGWSIERFASRCDERAQHLT
jgi:hypothetical protein